MLTLFLYVAEGVSIELLLIVILVISVYIMNKKKR